MTPEMMVLNQANKEAVWSFWQALEHSSPETLDTIVHQAMAQDMNWHGPFPLGEFKGPDKFISEFWQPLSDSFENLTRETHIFCSGESNGRVDGNIAEDGHVWVSGTGYLHGTFVRDYLSIPAHGQPVKIRWGEFCRMEGGKIVEIYILLDYIDLMQQAGFNVLPPARGRDHLYEAPAAGDGVMREPQDAAVSEYSLDHIRRFIFDGLNGFDEADLSSMGMADYFHRDLIWYGPGGIGGCLSFKEFEDFHQQHWLIAYPDRKVQNLDALIAEGAYSGGPGWAGVIATHTGSYLDVPATGRTVRFNGLDWWKREGEVYTENWVFVDMIDLFDQFGIDLFARLREQITDQAS